ncbi:MAG: hypothetical protein FWD06_03505 [Oscillospiraceae bacterium]|nr:hypothetical protein [Oscillospiraceae bacterium]
MQFTLDDFYIPVFLGEMGVYEQDHGVFYPAAVYFARAFAGLVGLLARYTGLEPTMEGLRNRRWSLTSILSNALGLMSPEAQLHIQANERALRMVYDTLTEADIPDSPLMGFALAELINIANPSQIYNVLRRPWAINMSSQEATATIEAWRSGVAICPELFRRYFTGAVFQSDGNLCCCSADDPNIEIFDLVLSIYLNNFARFMQDWDDVFGTVSAQAASMGISAPAVEPASDLLAFFERSMWLFMLATLDFEESTARLLVPAMLELGFSDRAAVQRYFVIHGVCTSYLDVALDSIASGAWRMQNLLRDVFIPVFLGEASLCAQEHGAFYPFFSYYSQKFTDIVMLLSRHIGVAPNTENLEMTFWYWVDIFGVAIQFARIETQHLVQTHERVMPLFYAAFADASLSDSAILGWMLSRLTNIACPDRIYNVLRTPDWAPNGGINMTSQQATATIEAWRNGDICPILFRDYFTRSINRLVFGGPCCCEIPEIFDLVFEIYLANFSDLMQDWHDVFIAQQPNPGPCMCPVCAVPPSELLAFAERNSWLFLLNWLGVEEESQQTLLPSLMNLGLSDRVAVQRYFVEHGVCVRELDVALSMISSGAMSVQSLVDDVFIPVFLGEDLYEQGFGEFYPLLAYYARVFAQLVQVVSDYIGLASNAEMLQEISPALAFILSQAFGMIGQDAPLHMQANARVMELMYRALRDADVPDSWQLGWAISRTVDIACPERMYNVFTTPSWAPNGGMDMSSQTAQATIEAWRSGDISPNLFRTYLSRVFSRNSLGSPCCCNFPRFDEIFDLIFNIYFPNFAGLMQDWHDVFIAEQPDPGPCTCLACTPCACLLCGPTAPQRPPSAPREPSFIGHLNPIRYRGKFYCDAMGWYWLQTRFYNPQWRRFINADTFFIAGEDGLSTLTASNMFAYANGNPVMMVDPDGQSAVVAFFASLSVWGWVGIIAGAIAAVAAVSAIVAGIWGWIDGFENNFWWYWGWSFLGTALAFIVVPSVVLHLLFMWGEIDIFYTGLVLPAFNLIGIVNYLGELSTWRDAIENVIGRWGPSIADIPRRIYIQNVGTNNLNLVDAMTFAVNAWNAALGTSMYVREFSGNSPPSGASIWFIGGTVDQLVSIRTTLLPGFTENFITGADRPHETTRLPRPRAGAVLIRAQNWRDDGLWIYNRNGSFVPRRSRRLSGGIPGFVRARDQGNLSATQLQNVYRNIATHELAHALGWWGHSKVSVKYLAPVHSLWFVL